MAAGLGFKTFTTGEVLTAADTNGYLMQGVLVFASSAARASALTSPQEGQYSFLKDTDSTEYYDGAAWVAGGDITGVTAGTGLSGGGSSGTVTLSINTAVTADLTTAQTLTNKTLTAGNLNNPLIKSPEERLTISATAATGTVAFDTQTQGILYYTTNASANFTLNFTNVNANLTTGDSISCVFLNTNGATAYYPNAFQVDSVAVTPKWSGGTAPTAGNASAIDSYSFIIIKTGAATFTVLAGGAVKFA